MLHLTFVVVLLSVTPGVGDGVVKCYTWCWCCRVLHLVLMLSSVTPGVFCYQVLHLVLVLQPPHPAAVSGAHGGVQV